MKRILSLMVVVAGFASIARAGGQNDAGCGLGSMLFHEQKPPHQIIASVTNQLASQSFAITTGSMGCTSGGLIKASKERSVFTATNYRALEREMAAGKGEYLTSLAALSGCKSDEFSTFAKIRYEKLIPSEKTTSVELLNNLDKEIAADATMSKACVL